MPKKTLALISGLVLVTVVLFVVAFNANKQQTQKPPITNTVPTASIVPAHSVLSLSPNPIYVGPGQQGKVDVLLDASDNNVTAVQLELGYDPRYVTGLQVAPGPAFPNSVALINKNNPQQGRMTYALAKTPNKPTFKGKGVIATITFVAQGQIGTQSQLALLPTTLITAQGVASSVLKSSTGTLITIGQPSAATGSGMAPAAGNTQTQSQPAQGSQTQTYPAGNTSSPVQQ